MLIFLLAQALKVSIVAGAINSLGSQDSYIIAPTASISVYGETSEYNYTPDLNVRVDLSSLPESDLEVTNARSFKSVEFEAGLEQGIPAIYPKLYLGFGIASRLPGDDQPRVNAAKYFTGGVRFSTKNRASYLYVGGGPDQRLDPNGLYVFTGHIVGMVKLYNYKDAKLSLKGDAILGGQSSLIRVGIVVGI